MYSKKPVISIETYYKDMQDLCNQIQPNEFDCIIALKRSGFILGAYLSNQLTIPLFIPSEIKSIPSNFTKILVVDDKICTGKSINKVVNKLPLLTEVKTACMYVESSNFPDIWLKDVKCIHGMWYERNKIIDMKKILIPLLLLLASCGNDTVSVPKAEYEQMKAMAPKPVKPEYPKNVSAPTLPEYGYSSFREWIKSRN